MKILDRERNNCLPFKFSHYIMNENILHKVGQREKQLKQEYAMNQHHLNTVGGLVIF